MKKTIISVLCSTLALITAPATTYTWTGAGFFGDQDYLWSNDFNWAGNAAPAPGEANVTLIFPNTTAPRVTTNDIAGLSVASIQFQGTNYVIHGKPAGNTLALSGGGFVGWTISANANGCYFAGTSPLSLNSYGVVNAAANCTVSVLSAINGTGGLLKAGPGTLKFSAAAPNSYAGATSVSDGMLDLNSAILFPAPAKFTSVPGPLIIGGTNSAYSPVVRLLTGHQIADTSPVTIHENGELWLNGNDDKMGPITLKGGKISTGLNGGGGSPGMLGLNGSVTNLVPADGSNGEISGLVHLGSFQRAFHIEGNSSLRIRANLYDSAGFEPGFVKTGAGELWLFDNVSTYAGPTIVQQGTLRLHGGTSLLGATNGGTVIHTNAQLVFDAAHIGEEPLTLEGAPDTTCVNFMFLNSNSWAGPITLNGDCTFIGFDADGFADGLTLSGAIGGPGLLRKKGNGSLVLTGSTANIFMGGMHVEEGSVVLKKPAFVSAMWGPLVIGQTNADVSYAAHVSVSESQQVPGVSDVTVYSSGFLYVQPGASQMLGDVTLAGGNLINYGLLSLSGYVTNRQATGEGISFISGDVQLTPGVHVFHCDTVSILQVAGVLSGGGALTKTGPGWLKFENANTYTGLTWVKDGTLALLENGRPGSTAAGTIIDYGARLFMSTSVTNEPLTLRGNYPLQDETFWTSGTNRWRGPITLEGHIAIETTSYLALDGPISGPGGWTYENSAGAGPGRIELTGADANTYAGATIVKGGTLLLNKPGVAAIPGELNILGTSNLWHGSNIWSAVRLLQPHQIADDSPVTISSVHELWLDGNAETIGSLAGDGKVNLGSATLVTGGLGSSTFSGIIKGSGGLTKTGSRTLTLTGNNIYTGLTAVNNGVLMVLGQQPTSAVTIGNGARLGGTGRTGNVTCFNGGIVSPGDGPGMLEGAVFNSIGSSAILHVEINGTSPAAYDQFKANGNVSFMGGTLQLFMNIPGAVGQQYIIIDNDGTDPVGGTFTALSEGSTITNNGVVFQISYIGGTGNDVVLTQMIAGTAPQLSGIDKLGNGTIQISATGFPNVTYTLEATASLTTPIQWTDLGPVTSDGNGLLQYVDADAPQFPMRFYRLRFP